MESNKRAETSLWTNSSPTSAMAATTVTLSNIENFKYLKIICRRSTSDATQITTLVSTNDLKNLYVSSGYNIIVGFPYGEVAHIRVFRANSATSLYIGPAIMINQPSVATNAQVIPVNIYGVN